MGNPQEAIEACGFLDLVIKEECIWPSPDRQSVPTPVSGRVAILNSWRGIPLVEMPLYFVFESDFQIEKTAQNTTLRKQQKSRFL